MPPGTFGSFIFARAAHDAGNRADTAFAETGTLPWLARKHGPFEVAITVAQASADWRAAAAAEGPCARRHRQGISRRDRGLRRRALGRADERRPDHPSAADHHERRAARAFRALGHPQGGHASRPCAVSPTRSMPNASRCARRSATARRIFRSQSLCARRRGVDVRPRLARQADRLRRLARAHRADAASLHAGGRADRPVVSGVMRRVRRRADAAGARVPDYWRGDLRRGFHADGADADVARPSVASTRATSRRCCAEGLR